MFEMAKVTVPVISIVIGEGSSGGALAIGVSNKIYMMEHAIYSILSPEGYSSILWKDSTRYKEAAEKMKLTAKDLYDLKIIDNIIEEPIKYEENTFKDVTTEIKKLIINDINEMKKLSKEKLVEQRYKKFRNISGFREVNNVIGK